MEMANITTHNVVSVAIRIENETNEEGVFLWDIMKQDKTFSIFIKILGFYNPFCYYDETDSIIIKILTKLWQFLLVVMAGIGFCWVIIMNGRFNMVHFYDNNVSQLINFGYITYYFVTPILQVTSVFMGFTIIYAQLKYKLAKEDKSINLITALLDRCKIDSIVFFVIMVLLVILIPPIVISPSSYIADYAGYDDYKQAYGLETYHRFAFYNVSILFYNLAMTSYLSLIMLFASFQIKWIQNIQVDMITSLDFDDSLSIENYKDFKNNINKLLDGNRIFVRFFRIFGINGLDVIQFLTLTASFQVLVFLFWIYTHWYEYLQNKSSQYTREYMVKNMLLAVPYLLKGKITSVIYTYHHHHHHKFIENVFLFYVLLNAAAINENKQIFNKKLAEKIIELPDPQKSSKIHEQRRTRLTKILNTII